MDCFLAAMDARASVRRMAEFARADRVPLFDPFSRAFFRLDPAVPALTLGLLFLTTSSFAFEGGLLTGATFSLFSLDFAMIRLCRAWLALVSLGLMDGAAMLFNLGVGLAAVVLVTFFASTAGAALSDSVDVFGVFGFVAGATVVTAALDDALVLLALVA